MNKLIKSIITGMIFGISFWGFCLASFFLMDLSDILEEIYYFFLPDPFAFLIILYALLASLILIKAVKFPERWWQLIIFSISSILSSLIVEVTWSYFETDIGIPIVFLGSCTATWISTVCLLAIFLFKRLISKKSNSEF